MWTRMFNLPLLLFLLCMVTCLQAAQKPILQTLIDQAYYWQDRQRQDRAAELWHKILMIAPEQIEALLGLANYAKQQHDDRQLDAYLKRLRIINPNHPGLIRLEESLYYQPDPQRLKQARDWVQQNQVNKALLIYKQLAAEDQLSPKLQIEYYETLAGTQTGWNVAQQRLTELVKQHPNRPGIALSKAKVLTYRPITRTEGMRRLRRLQTHSNRGISQAANQAWKQARMWQGSTIINPSKPTLEPGFKALEHNHLNKAQQYFQKHLIKYPKDAEASAGLGLIALKQERFRTAARLLEQAIQTLPSSQHPRWQPALDSAHFWALFRESEAARKQHQWSLAEARVRKALKLQPEEINAQRLLSEVLRQQAQIATQRSQLTQADRLLQEALSIIDHNQWSQLALVYLRRQQGRAADAKHVLGQLLTQQPALPEALFAEALLYADQQNWIQAMGTLHRIPILTRSQATKELQQRVNLMAELASITDLLKHKQRTQGFQRLQALQVNARTPELISAVATTWSEADEPQQALQFMRQALASLDIQMRQHTGLRIHYAGLLLQAHDWDNLHPELQQLQSKTKGFSNEARKHLTAVQTAYALHQIDQLQLQGAYEQAATLLKPLLAENPDSKQLQNALNRLHTQQADKHYAALATGIRNRSGQAGLERLTESHITLETRLPIVLASGHLKLRASLINLNAGSVKTSTQSRFGSIVLNPAWQHQPLKRQKQSGAALELAYHQDSWQLAIGTTPLGFQHSTWTGRLNWKPHWQYGWLDLKLDRQPVTDSLLSYAGTRDPLSGRFWGAVSRLGGSIGTGKHLDRLGAGWYLQAGYHIYEGQRLPTNTRWSMTGGLYRQVYADSARKLTMGLNLTAMGFDNNQGQFTLGHGGYFSPEYFVSATIPFDFKGHTQRWRYQFKGAVGVQHFMEARADVFPGQRGLQTRLTQTGIYPTQYPGQQSTSLAYRAQAGVEYLLQPHFVVGVALGTDNARDYQDVSGMLYLKYHFNARQAFKKSEFDAVRLPFLRDLF